MCFGASLTPYARSPNLATVAMYGISLIDDVLRVTLEPVTLLEPSNPSLVWLQVIGTALAAFAALGSAYIAWRAHSFAQEAQMQRQALERHYKTQEAARDMLTAGVLAADRALPVIRRMPKTQDAAPDELADQAALSAFEAKAQLLGAHFPDGDRRARKVEQVAKAFRGGIEKCRSEDDVARIVKQLRVDAGPFLRSPNAKDLRWMYQDAIKADKRIAAEREEQDDAAPAT